MTSASLFRVNLRVLVGIARKAALFLLDLNLGIQDSGDTVSKAAGTHCTELGDNPTEGKANQGREIEPWDIT